MAFSSGHRLKDGYYVIEKEIGRGGFGITYRAKSKNAEQVVIKTLNDDVQHSVLSRYGNGWRCLRLIIKIVFVMLIRKLLRSGFQVLVHSQTLRILHRPNVLRSCISLKMI